MGSSSSKSQGQVMSKHPPPAQPPEPPYPGPPAQYQFVNTQVMIGTNLSFSFTTTPMVTSNIDSYYPALAAQYAQGYRFLSFYRIPGQQQQTGFFSTTLAVGFQGIFCRYPHMPPAEHFQLRIEKSVIQAQRQFTGIISLNSGVVSDNTHILDSIARNTQTGGRLVCIEMTGQQHSTNVSMAMRGITAPMGVDLFFEVPNTPQPEQYVYNCASVPIVVTMEMGFRPTPRVHCDWIGTLASFLNQGWRLVEIFMDMASFTQARGFSGQTTLNSLWFFEKPASRMNDPSPRYQGTVVDHLIKIQPGLGGSQTTANWEPVIQEMGNKGWELACILETPEYHFSGMATVKMICKLFFQRPILAPANMPPPAANMAPPAYSEAVGGPGPQSSGDPKHGAPPPAGFSVAPPPEKMGY